MERPTIMDVARDVGVSTATVSNALTGHRPVDPDTRKRVVDAAMRLGYTPNLRARQLRTGRADTIAIFSSMPSSIAGGRSRMGFLLEIAGAAAAKSLQRGIALMLVPPMEVGWESPRDFHIDGAIVVEPLANDVEVAALRNRNVAVVTIGQQSGCREIPFVDLQSSATTSTMLQHLVDQSARNIAIIIGCEQRNSYLEAGQAYLTFVRRHRMHPEIIKVEEAGGEEAARMATDDLIRRRPDIDGIYASVDVFADGALRALIEAGKHVPSDIKLATRYNGFRARDSSPSITSFDMRLDEVGAAAVELLMEQMQDGKGRQSAHGPTAVLIQRDSSRDKKKP